MGDGTVRLRRGWGGLAAGQEYPLTDGAEPVQWGTCVGLRPPRAARVRMEDELTERLAEVRRHLEELLVSL